MLARPLISVIALLALAACSSNDAPHNAGAVGGEAGKPSSGGGAGGSSSTAGPHGDFGGGPTHTGPMFAGAECPTDLGLPDAYALPNVKGVIEGSNVRISFDPQGDAKDYRVYALPAAGDVKGDAIKGAVHRCAGNSEVPVPAFEDAKTPENPGIRTRAASKVKGVDRAAADA